MNPQKVKDLSQALMDVLSGEPTIEGLFALSSTVSACLIGISESKKDSLEGLNKFSKMTQAYIQENYDFIKRETVYFSERGQA